jgi:hypothetical protein
VNWAGAELRQRLAMRQRAVSFMLGEPVSGEFQVKLAQQRISPCLGEDGSGGDA